MQRVFKGRSLWLKKIKQNSTPWKSGGQFITQWFVRIALKKNLRHSYDKMRCKMRPRVVDQRIQNM